MSVEHHSALPAGHRLHEYRVERVLGFGGFGITYLATDTNLNKQVAIKEYLPAALAVRTADASIVPSAGDYAADFRWGLERFIEEARTLARFRHANLVPVHRYFEANGTAYVVMEYERGERLDDFLKRKPGALPQAELLALLAGLLDGLEAVHRAGYLHRDIKPTNIILRQDGTPVLLDFGAARQALGQRSQTVTAIVTPGYAPLEQYAGDGKQGPWTDLYAVGALAHRLIVGVPPPEATTRARTDPYRPLAERRAPGYAPALLGAIDWALQVDEHRRPQSVREFRRALASGRPAATVIASGAAAKPRRMLPLFAALAFLMLLGGGYYFYQGQSQQERDDFELQRQQQVAREEQTRAAIAAAKATAEKAVADKAAADRAAADRAAADKAAADKAAAERAAAEKAAADKAASAKAGAASPAAPAAMTSERAAALAREAAARARQILADANRSAELARGKAAQARDNSAVAAQKAAAAGDAGRIELAGGAIYFGSISDNLRHGAGVMTTPSGLRYEGQWRNNTPNGLGVMQEGGAAPNRYAGEWVEGRHEGHGVYHWRDGFRYEGEFRQGRRTGLGIMFSADGSFMAARWIEASPDVLVVKQNARGDRYEGSMSNQKLNGAGVQIFADGQRYEGEFRDDERNGQGILFLPNGTRRSGLWRDGELVKPD